MASASTLLKLTPLLQWNPTFSYTKRNHHHTDNNLFFFSQPQRKPNPIRLQISCGHKQLNTDARTSPDSAPVWKNLFDQIAVGIKKALDSLKKPAVAAVLLGFLLFYDPNCALARSGGRTGRSSFSSSSRSSSSSSSSSRSSSFSSSSPSPSSSSSSYTSYSFSPDAFFLSVVCGVVLLHLLILLSSLPWDLSEYSTETTSVVKLQEGLLGSGRTIQQDLNRLAENANTSIKEGLSHVLTEATLALLRHPDYCISCYSSVDVKWIEEEAENRFKQLSIEERGKFDEETLVNVNSIKQKSSKIQRASNFDNEYIVVTILVAAKGIIPNVQPINGIEDLKEALQTLRQIQKNRILAVEILWTPQDEKEAMSERELLEDYPLLKPL